jgi:spore maturation protein CgeB
MKIIYAGIRGENYDPARSPSFEYTNFYGTLAAMPGLEVIEYPYDRILDVGRKRFNRELLDLVRREQPDLLFAFMYTDELDADTLDEIKKLTTSVAWFADDYWRFWNYSRHWPPHFSYVVTTYSRAVEWYRRAGFTNVIRSQWGCNTAVYRPIETAKDIAVSFVGQYKPGRGRVIRVLRRAGIAIEPSGVGWPNGRLPQDEMLHTFSRSRINLNLTDRANPWSPSVLARLFLKRSVDRLVPDLHLIDNARAYLHFTTPQTHARPFELAGCRAFVLSGVSEDIGACYIPDREMVFYRSAGELVDKVRYYLAHDDERERIAEAGYRRTLRDHTYDRRFKDLFAAIGLDYHD